MNEKWWDKFYTDMEKGLSYGSKRYTRPADWKERAHKAESKQRKPVQNQYEGRKDKYHEN